MNLCSDGHEEVCFEGRTCPACSLRDDLEKRIDKLTDDINSLESEIADYESTGE
jgi:hypothetical protein